MAGIAVGACVTGGADDAGIACPSDGASATNAIIGTESAMYAYVNSAGIAQTSSG